MKGVKERREKGGEEKKGGKERMERMEIAWKGKCAQ